MYSCNSKRGSGLILLVVLGMLSLFSMLAITYVVFSSQSRTANLAMARGDFRGTPPAKLLDDAFHQVLRGSADPRSFMWHEGLLPDFYGDGIGISDGFIIAAARTTQRDNPGRQANSLLPALPIAANTLEAPRILSSTFLKIPLQWNAALPEQHDVMNGRVLTFLQGPLAGESFRIVRYLGEMPSAPAPPTTPPSSLIFEQSLQYSVTIDFSSVLNRMVTVGTTTQSLQEWISSSSALNGAALCYDLSSSTPYNLQINSAPLNSFGAGIAMDGTLQTNAAASNIPALSHLTPPQNQLPASYQSLSVAFFPNFSHTRSANPSFLPAGDLDEPLDVADYSDFHLTYQISGATDGDGIIPAFHRPAVINHVFSSIVSGTPLASFTPIDLFSTIELMQRACGRPLSFTITGLPGAIAPAPLNGTISQNANFSGSNAGLYVPIGNAQTPNLVIDWSQWGSGPQEQRFEAWVRWLMRGPWDVDADGDGINDSNWIDLNYPLMTSREGKLLKMMAAYYIEDLGGRLNLNSGNLAQTIDTNFGGFTTDARFAFASSNSLLPQGLGMGSGSDISLRHLFPTAADYQRFVGERNGALQTTPLASLITYGPGENGDSYASLLRQRHRLANHNATTLPGLPQSIFGKTGLGLDLYGNPISFETTQYNQIVDDPYEARILSTTHSDRPYTIPEWERLTRLYDWDHSSLPRRLERILFPAAVTPAVALSTSRSVTPRSSSLEAPTFGGTYQYTRLDPTQLPPSPPQVMNVTRRIGSFLELVEALAQQRFLTPPGPGVSYPYFPTAALTQLFPIEFNHNLKLDLNRPIGNGLDDDGDGLVDEPDEVRSGQFAEYATVTYNTATVGAGNEIYEQYALNGGILDPYYEDASRTGYETATFGGNQGKQMLARHLYCLAQLILPNDYVFPNQNQASGIKYAYGTPERARILAQWAVNVVDYRDADATMTRFPYDNSPLTQKPSGAFWEPPLSPGSSGGVVWGREEQELTLTESFAFHDLRISEKNNPAPGTNKWQQLRIPEGSLYLEFLCTRSRYTGDGLSAGVPRGGLYSFNTTSSPNLLQLNLSAVSPPDGSSESFPVWRVLLLEPHTPGDSVDDQYQDPAKRDQLDFQFATAAGLPWSSQSASPPATPAVNRVVWFSNLAATAGNLALPGVSGMGPEKVYRNRSGTAVLVEGGQYLVVGPRDDTYVGQREQSNSPPLHHPSRHRISLQTGWTQCWAEDGNPGMWVGPTRPTPLSNGEPLPTPAPYLRDCVTILASADSPAAWTNITRTVGLNISEPNPNSYYPEPTSVLNGDTAGANSMPDPITGAPGYGSTGFPLDAYVDLNLDPNANSPHDPQDLTKGPLATSGWAKTSAPDERPNVETRLNWSTAVLQRLANPDLPWHEALNPYISIDWLPIDLTVFSGEHAILEDNQIRFASRQKTGLVVDPSTSALIPPATIATSAGRTFFSYHSEPGQRTQKLSSTITEPGYFDYRTPLELVDLDDTTAAIPDPANPRITSSTNTGQFTSLGYLNSRFGLRGLNGGTAYTTLYNGTPAYANAAVYFSGGSAQALVAPFHANRDFVSAHELMSVPMSSPGQMMLDFTPTPPSAATAFAYNHLLDFEMTSVNSTSTSKSAAAILELVGTRNPWMDAAKTLDPGKVYVPSPSSANDNLVNNALAIYRAPYNNLPTFLEPAKVNINTASEAAVLRGVMWSSIPETASVRTTAAIPYQMELQLSRSGILPGNGTSGLSGFIHPNLDKRWPTQFPGAFKTGFAANRSAVPVPPLPIDNFANSGILRQDSTGMKRLFSTAAGVPHNPIVENYPVSRLTNLVTDRSNVYSVRVTIGFFEFDPVTGLGQEYGIDAGTSRRHRAFYVVDRSVPVAYQPGQDLNTDKCILLRRVIE